MEAGRLRGALGLAAAVATGAALRLDQIHEQIVLDDEWHALHAILRFGYARILTDFGWTDHCIPLSLYDKAIADTVGLSEIWMRLPVLLCGIGTLLVIPLLVRGWVGRTAGASFAWLLAIAPLHVFLSRLVRPYAIHLLLLLVGGLTLARWWEDGRPRWAVLGAAALVLAPYFHLSALFHVLAVLGLGLLIAGARPGACPRPRRAVMGVAAAVVLGLAVLVGPPLAMSYGMQSDKAFRSGVGLATVAGALELMTGTARAPLQAALVALALGGAAVLARERPRLLWLLGAFVASGPVVIVVVRSIGVSEPSVTARYCLPALPAGALLVAVALSRSEGILRGRGVPCPAGTLTAVTAAGLFLAGPLPRIYARPNNWTNHGVFQYDYDPERLARWCPPEVSPFYHELARQPPGSLRIVEAPWWHGWESIYHPCYQRVHGQYMAIGFVSGRRRAASPTGLPRAAELPLLDPGRSFRFRNFVHVSDEAGLRRRAIRYVVFHRSLETEMGVDSPDYRVDIAPWIAHYRSRYGPPAYEDGLLVAFDVGALAQSASQP